MTKVSGYNAWVRKTIVEEGIVSFAQCPIPDTFPSDNCKDVSLSCSLADGAARSKLTDVLMTVILNFLTEGVAI
jgi:hypothetical protein